MSHTFTDKELELHDLAVKIETLVTLGTHYKKGGILSIPVADLGVLGLGLIALRDNIEEELNQNG